MIEIEKREIPLCCGRKQLVFKVNRPFLKEDIPTFTDAGFSYLQGFFKSGILYLEDKGVTATTPIGGNELHIRCKGRECQDSIAKLEKTILTLI